MVRCSPCGGAVRLPRSTTVVRSCTSSLNSTPLHLYPGRPLWSYLRNLANMVNRAAKKLEKKNADSQTSGWYLFPVGNNPKYTAWFLYLC